MKPRSQALGNGIRTALVLLILALSLHGWRTTAFASPGTDDYQRGAAAAHAGQYPAAARDFEQALLHGHDDPNTFYQLGLAYSKLKRWNDATWALATAASDDAFSATTPAVQKALAAAGAAGGADVGPPAQLRGVKMSPMRLTPEQNALIESRSVLPALQGNGTYFVAPAFNSRINVNTVGALTAAAADLQNNSNTAVKFVFLSATPAPYTSLAAYTKDLFGHLGLQRAVLVVVTPKTVSAFSDRLDSAAADGIAASQYRTLGTGDPVALAAGIARAVTRRADGNDTANTQRSVAIGAVIALVILASVALAVRRVARRDPVTSTGYAARRSRVATKPRAR